MKKECKCHELPGDYCLAERPRYFPRQIITADDLTLDQDYFRNKLRRHNRLLHGWGVVCGALACPIWKCQDKVIEPWKVIVHPGYVLSPCGDEIIIDCPRTVDLRRPNLEEKPKDPCGESVDPWCTEVCPEETRSGPLYLAVKYKEIRMRPVRVQPVGCGCDDQPCEYSRFCDGYEFGLLTSCPESHLQDVCNPEVDCEKHIKDFFKQCNPECPPCPEEPWVVLAEIEIGEDGQVKRIDNCACRRLVISAAPFWWKCPCSLQINKHSNKPVQIKANETQLISITLTGAGAKEPIKANAGLGITVVAGPTLDQAKPTVTMSLKVDPDAKVGERLVILTDANCSTISFPITVGAAEVPVETGNATRRGRRKKQR